MVRWTSPPNGLTLLNIFQKKICYVICLCWLPVLLVWPIVVQHVAYFCCGFGSQSSATSHFVLYWWVDVFDGDTRRPRSPSVSVVDLSLSSLMIYLYLVWFPLEAKFHSTVNGIPLHSFFIALSSSWYDWSTGEKDVKLLVIHCIVGVASENRVRSCA